MKRAAKPSTAVHAAWDCAVGIVLASRCVLPGSCLVLALGACSSLPALPVLPALSNPISLGTLPVADSVTVQAGPTVVYAAIAQKAKACWFGPKGPLQETHLFHADVASPTTGGRAEIALQEREKTLPHPWGARAFRIDLVGQAGGESTHVSIFNIKLPKDLAEALHADVIRWAEGRDSCQAKVVRPPPPDPVPLPPKVKVKKAKAG
jgi:hypothetical protein